MRRFLSSLGLSLLTILAFTLLPGTHWQFANASPSIYYVSPGGSDSNTGISWASAFKTLQKALSQAQIGQQIWVAAGTYYPDEIDSANTDDRFATFSLKNGVDVYGGFTGLESSLEQRAPQVNLTILSGDLQQDDDPENKAYHVVNAFGTLSSAVLDGFSITAGAANGSSNNSLGGGIFILNGNPTLHYLMINQNEANYGGGVYCENSSPNLTEITISENKAYTAGGGMYTYNGSSPKLERVTFSGNSAVYGGGMENDLNSNFTLVNSTFSGNSASDSGGALYIYASSPTLTNITLAENNAPAGSGIYNLEGGITLKNALIAGACVNQDGSVTASHTLVQDSGSACDLQNDENGNIIGEDPLLSLLQDNGGYTLTHLPQFLSPVIDSGNLEGCPATDQRGVVRPSGIGCDIGAVEVVIYRLYLPLLLKNP